MDIKDHHIVSKEKAIEYLSELITDTPLPASIEALSEHEILDICKFVQQVIDQKTAGLDRLFEMMSKTMKYIPNFVIHSMSIKYIAPAIAARITEKLTIKQALGVADGLPLDYSAEVARYSNNHLSAEILSHMKPLQMKKVVYYLARHYPIKLLDIAEQLNESMISSISKYIDYSVYSSIQLQAPKRKAMLAKLQSKIENRKSKI
ncbi:MAG: hypothetical protein HQK77_17840 [Desulfobacterales bacterium]|nr:hypothetical protein [Desulfobacterales bacterium]